MRGGIAILQPYNLIGDPTLRPRLAAEAGRHSGRHRRPA